MKRMSSYSVSRILKLEFHSFEAKNGVLTQMSHELMYKQANRKPYNAVQIKNILSQPLIPSYVPHFE